MFILETSCVMLNMEIMTVQNEKHMKLVSAVCGQKLQFLNVTAGSACG